MYSGGTAIDFISGSACQCAFLGFANVTFSTRGNLWSRLCARGWRLGLLDTFDKDGIVGLAVIAMGSLGEEMKGSNCVTWIAA